MTDDSWYRFYSETGRLYPEEDIVYSTLRGILRRRFILKHIGQWNGSMLDVGCNRGMYMAFYTGGRAYGIDLSVDAMKEARKREKSNPHPIYCMVGDAQNLDFIKSESFDHVLCSEVIEHVYDPGNVLDGIVRVLKPGGTVLITTPNYTKEKPEWVDTGNLSQYGIKGVNGDSYFHTAFKPSELSETAQNAGLEIIEKGTIEKEIRYAVKIPVLFYFLIDFINRNLFKNRKIFYWNRNLLNKLSLKIYKTACFLKVDRILQALFREGARTYLVARRPENRSF